MFEHFGPCALHAVWMWSSPVLSHMRWSLTAACAKVVGETHSDCSKLH